MLKESIFRGRTGALLFAAFFAAGLISSVAATTYQQIQSFGSPTSVGTQPLGQLIEASDGFLYGTTFGGGTNSKGTIFKLAQTGTVYSVIFNLTNASLPTAGVIECPDGALYGVGSSGGVSNIGAIFKLDKTGDNYTVLHDFTNGVDGSTPKGGLLRGQDGLLYGTTTFGGISNAGTIFRINTNGSGYSTLYTFTGIGNADGANPVASLIQGTNGLLYGTTQVGGSGNFGTVFKIDTNGGGYGVLHHFMGPAVNDGSQPLGSVVLAHDGLLYGTTSFGGGGPNRGTIFKVNTSGNNYAIIHAFATNSAGGSQPSAGLMEALNGALYGTARFSDTNHGNSGTIFRISKDGSSFTILHNFTGNPDGNQPQSALIRGSDGAWYGITGFGGTANLGTAFKIFPPITIDHIARTGSNAVLNCSDGAVGQFYEIQATTNLTVTNSWLVIGSNSAAADGSFQFTDTNAFHFQQRFYRTATP